MSDKIKLHPIDRDIIRSMRNLRLGVTPSKIAKTINIHPTTAQKHIDKLSKIGIMDCKPKGNRNLCKINSPALKRILKGGF